MILRALWVFGGHRVAQEKRTNSGESKRGLLFEPISWFQRAAIDTRSVLKSIVTTRPT